MRPLGLMFVLFIASCASPDKDNMASPCPDGEVEIGSIVKVDFQGKENVERICGPKGRKMLDKTDMAMRFMGKPTRFTEEGGKFYCRPFKK